MRILIILIVLILQLSTSAQQLIKTNISKVKIFLNGAELTHTAHIKLKKGNSDIIFYGIAQNILPNSINISTTGDIKILSTSQRIDYLKPQEKNREIKILEDSLKVLNKMLTVKQNDIDVLKAEIELLFANKEIGGKDRIISINELQKFSDYFRRRLNQIKNLISETTLEINELQKNIDRITKQLNELNNNLNKPVNELIVSVLSNSKIETDFIISYLINEATWQPVYDIRVANINSPVHLFYKAKIKQNSGLDWNNAEIVLSTRNTLLSNEKPELTPWFVDFERTSLRKDTEFATQKVFSPQVLTAEEIESASSKNFEILQTQLTAEFIPPVKYSIPSDNKQHLIDLQNFTINANYEYYAAPKLDNNAFLIAYLTNWNEYNLLPGEANIYFENSYTGKTFINPFVSKDTLTISLSRDQNISVVKNILRDFTEYKFLSNDIERTFAFEIKIRNNKSLPVKLIVEDNIPISKNEEIIVKLINSDNGKYFDSDGKIRWNILLEASKSVTKKLIYSIRHPKDKRISNL